MEALDSVIRERIVAAYARPTRITRTKDVGIDWKVSPHPLPQGWTDDRATFNMAEICKAL